MSHSEKTCAEPLGEDSYGISNSMNLLSLTIQSLELKDMASSTEDFLEVESKEEKCDVTKDRRIRSSQSETIRNSVETKESKNLRTIGLSEVAWHDTADSCWLVIHDYVYDCTDFLNNHPGGMDVLLEYAGRDATLPFIGTGHSSAARQSLESYLIGELPPEERIFRVNGGVKVYGF